MVSEPARQDVLDVIEQAQAVVRNAAVVRELLRRSGEDPSTARPGWIADLSETRWKWMEDNS